MGGIEINGWKYNGYGVWYREFENGDVEARVGVYSIDQLYDETNKKEPTNGPAR